MSILDSLFAKEKTFRVSVQAMSQTNTNGILGSKVYTTTKTVDGLIWRGPLSDRLVNEKFRPDVQAVVLLRPSEISVQEIPADGRLLITDAIRYCKINHTGGYTAGALTIAVDETFDSACPIKKKDTFSIAGETESPTHTVTAVTSTDGVTTGMTFTTAIAAGGVLDNALITVTPVMGYYSIIYPDNIGGQDEVIMIPLKEFV